MVVVLLLAQKVLYLPSGSGFDLTVTKVILFSLDTTSLFVFSKTFRTILSLNTFFADFRLISSEKTCRAKIKLLPLHQQIPPRLFLMRTRAELLLLYTYELYKTTFGTLSKLFENFADKHVKKVIAREFNLPQHLYLESWIKCIAVLRNCIAHHSRIWNRKFPLKPQMPLKLNGMWIDCSGIERAKLYAQLCCLAYLQNHIHPDNDFKQQLKSLLLAHPNVDVAAMGFPVGWENEPLWK